MATAMLCAVVAASDDWQECEQQARISVASAGSPIQPRPMLAIVMPSCVAAM